MLLVKKI